MKLNVPIHITIAFILTTIVTLLLFKTVLDNSKSEQTKNQSWIIISCLIAWLALQMGLSINDVYSSDLRSFPPKLIRYGVLPVILVFIVLFVTRRGKKFIDHLPLLNITYLNIVRIPVEIILLWLFINKTIPEIMTFEGRNFDILAGITAPFIAYYGIKNQRISPKAILLWNIFCLGLLINIVFLGLFSAPTPAQKFGFDQPNIAILYFPFSWLPTFIVPLVLFGHLVSIRQLFNQKTQ